MKSKVVPGKKTWVIEADNLKENSILIHNIEITATLEFTKNRFLVAARNGILLIVNNWTQIKQVECPVNVDRYWLAKMPMFDSETFPFCIAHGSPIFNLINVK